MSDVAGREDAGDARLLGERPSRQWELDAVVGEVLTGQQEPLRVPSELRRQPVRVRASADQHEEAIGVDRLLTRVAAQHELLQTSISAAPDDLRAGSHLDVRRRRDLADEVVGHSLGER